jgi:hypothetical protein
MELNLFFAIVAPIAMIAVINWLLQRGESARAPLVMPSDAIRHAVAQEERALDIEAAANDEHSELAA